MPFSLIYTSNRNKKLKRNSRMNSCFVRRSKEAIVNNLRDTGRYRLAKYILQCGYVVNHESWAADLNVTPRNQMHEKDIIFMKQAKENGQKVQSLSNYCRIAIRGHLCFSSRGTDIKQRINELGLPASLTQFLCFQSEYEELVRER